MARHRGGWVKIHRSIDDPDPSRNIYADRPAERDIFIWLVRNAMHTDCKTELRKQKVKPKRGQLATSLREISKEVGRGIQVVRTTLDWLELTHQITRSKTHAGTLITILDYDKFQSSEDDVDTPNNTPTNTQPTHGQHYNEEYNKNEKKIYTPHFYDEEIYNKWKDWAVTQSTTVKPNLKNWCETFRKLREIDKISFEQITSLLEFIKTDKFWSRNAISPVSLRDRSKNGLLKWENVKAAMTERKPPSEERIINYEEL